tara:strand:- start:4172 stop:5188 length:1017 start_codon:yes stop_codon:yes gene_type:complete
MSKPLEDLYSDLGVENCNPKCKGCSILKKNKPHHSVMDYEEMDQCDILFVTDSLNYSYGKVRGTDPKAMNVLNDYCHADFLVTGAVKCPGTKEEDMTTEDKKLCRVHILDTIEHVRPKLVYACGNAAMKQITKQSGIIKKRGAAIELELESGFKTVVVPIFHPYSVIKEPKNEMLFNIDVQNAYNIYILGKKGTSNFDYSVLMTLEEVAAFIDRVDKTVAWACDTETTGLDFLSDDITTISITTPDETCVIPFMHKDSPFLADMDKLRALINLLFSYDNRKIWHNVKFDLRMLMRQKIYIDPKNLFCTQMFHHIWDENLPKSLMDIIKIHFPEELAKL